MVTRVFLREERFNGLGRWRYGIGFAFQANEDETKGVFSGTLPGLFLLLLSFGLLLLLFLLVLNFLHVRGRQRCLDLAALLLVLVSLLLDALEIRK